MALICRHEGHDESRRKSRITDQRAADRPALTIAATGSLGDAARAMRRANVSCALTDDGRIVTERDLTRGLAAGLGARDPVDEVAVPDPVAVVASLPVLHAAELMAARQIRHLVLTTDRGDPLGIVSIRDIVGVL